MSKFIVSLAGLALLLSACGGGGSNSEPPAPDAARQPSPSVPEQPEEPEVIPVDCHKTSWVAGTTELCDGTLIYRDYIYDDYGADVGLVGLSPLTVANLISRGGGLFNPVANTPGLLSPTAGDQRYPSGMENTADLVSLALSLDGDELAVRFELNTLYGDDDSIAAIAIDTDNNRGTGGGVWPGLGIHSDGWDVIHTFREGDPINNVIEGRIPAPESDEWRVQAVVAQSDGTVMNVAFRGPRELARAASVPEQILPDAGNFWEDRQARALGDGDISLFGKVVARSDMERRVTRPAEPVTGFQQRVYTSDYTLPPGEGVSLRGVPGRQGDTGLPCDQYFHYLGKYQPYGVYVPEAPGPHELQLVLHGCEANHASQINQPNFQAAFGDAHNRILAAPLGRGPRGFYTGLSERDVLDVRADVQAHYEIDERRVQVSGYSMGGYGTLRLASLYPQDYAAGVNWVGFTGSLLNLPLERTLLGSLAALTGIELLDVPLSAFQELQQQFSIGAEDNVLDYLGNLEHIPMANAYSAADELVHITTALALQEKFVAGDSDYVFYLHLPAEHLTYILLDEWQKMADYSADRAAVSQPATVEYYYDPAQAYPEYGIDHNRAYWVSNITNRSTSPSRISLYSDGCGTPRTDADFDTGLGAYPVPWASTQRTLTRDADLPGGNTLSGSLENIHHLTVDVSDSCLPGAIDLDINSDGNATLEFSDGRSVDLVQGRNRMFLNPR